jgi:hypothetical protein
MVARFSNKDPNLGKYWRTFAWSHGKCWYLLCPFVHFVVIWYIFPHFGILFQEKSGNPAVGKY